MSSKEQSTRVYLYFQILTTDAKASQTIGFLLRLTAKYLSGKNIALLVLMSIIAPFSLRKSVPIINSDDKLFCSRTRARCSCRSCCAWCSSRSSRCATTSRRAWSASGPSSSTGTASIGQARSSSDSPADTSPPWPWCSAPGRAGWHNLCKQT